MVTKAGAKLLSVKEPIGEESSHGILLEGVMAAAAAARRIEISEEVKRGIKRKIEVGGTSGLAPIGYLNVREPLPHGGEVRTIAIDPERGRIVVWAFETYATGLYSLSDITVLLEARGLYTRATRRLGPQPLSLSRVHKLLRSPYYAGYVTHKGHVYEGRHEALISQELFDQVQAVLVAHRHSGERDRKHQHYLKGTIRCGTCGSQLVYSMNKGNGGIYEYFVCPRNQRGECLQGYQPIDLVEAAIEDHYATVPFSAAEREEVRKEITKDLGERVATAQQEIERCEAVLEEVKEQERKLLHMHYEDRISGELFDDEQARIRERRKDAEELIARLSVRYEDIAATLAARARDPRRRPTRDVPPRRRQHPPTDQPGHLQCAVRLRRNHHRGRVHRAIRSATRPTRRNTRPARQRRTPGRTPPTPPALPRERKRPRPLPGPGTFPRWFD